MKIGMCYAGKRMLAVPRLGAQPRQLIITAMTIAALLSADMDSTLQLIYVMILFTWCGSEINEPKIDWGQWNTNNKA